MVKKNKIRDSAKIREMTPDTHTLLRVSSGDRRGGGVGIFISKSFSKIRKEKVPKTDNFELKQASCIYGRKKAGIHYSRIEVHLLMTSSYRNEFRLYLESLNLVRSEVFVCGDFNFWVDDVENESAKYLLGPNCSVFKKRLKMHVFADCY